MRVRYRPPTTARPGTVRDRVGHAAETPPGDDPARA
jgi:hypothetical protein